MKSAFRADIEGLRAVAVTLVVAFHFGVSGLPGGFVGVDLFFVISGYLISSLLTKEIGRSGTIDFVAFYGRRARRLLPAALVMCGVTLALSPFILSPLEARDAGKGALWTSLYVSNLWFVRQAFDYFAPAAALNPFLHTWSLGVEEQFYGVWPAMILALSRRGRARFAKRSIIGVSLVSLAACLWLVHVRAPWAFFLMPTRIWEFGAGAVISVGTPVAQPKNAILRNLIAAIAGLSIAASALLLQEKMLFPSYSALVPVAGVALLLWLGEGRSTIMTAILASRPLQAIGARSYSLYLWHWPVIVLARAWWGTLGPIAIALCVVATGLLAWLSYAMVETPVRASRWLQSARWRSLQFSALATATGVAVSALAVSQAVTVMRAPYLVAINAEAAPHPDSIQNGRKCFVEFFNSDPNICIFGKSGLPRAVLFGDSHADQWFLPMRRAAERRGYAFVTVLKAGCPAIELSDNHRMSRECATWRARALVRIDALHPAVIVLAQAGNVDVQRPNRPVDTDLATLPEWREGLLRVLPRLRATGARVILLRDTPSPGQDIPRCLGRQFNRHRPWSECNPPRSQALYGDLAGLEQATAIQAGVDYVDMSDIICGPRECPVLRAGHLMYHDASHMTDAAHDALENRLFAVLGPALSPRFDDEGRPNRSGRPFCNACRGKAVSSVLAP